MDDRRVLERTHEDLQNDVAVIASEFLGGFQKVLEIEDCARYRAPFVLEGGAIHVDGQGTCITTEECLLDPNRNPTLTRSQIEDRLRAYLNVEVVIWLGRGVYRDETDADYRTNALAQVIERRTVSSTDRLSLAMGPGGGRNARQIRR